MSEIIMILRKGGSLIIQVILLFLVIFGWQSLSRERQLLIEKNQYLLKLYKNTDIAPKEREFLQSRINETDYFLSHKLPFFVDLCLVVFGSAVYAMWMISFPIWVVKKKDAKEP